jgi:hypothetical protein
LEASTEEFVGACAIGPTGGTVGVVDTEGFPLVVASAVVLVFTGISTLKVGITGTTPGLLLHTGALVDTVGKSLFKSPKSPSPPFFPRGNRTLPGVGVDLNGTELQKFLSSASFLVAGVMNGFIPSNFFVQSSMLTVSWGLGGLVGDALGDSGLTLSRENADAKRRSSTGGGVFGTSLDWGGFDDDGRCWEDFRRAVPVEEIGGVSEFLSVLLSFATPSDPESFFPNPSDGNPFGTANPFVVNPLSPGVFGF